MYNQETNDPIIGSICKFVDINKTIFASYITKLEEPKIGELFSWVNNYDMWCWTSPVKEITKIENGFMIVTENNSYVIELLNKDLK